MYLIPTQPWINKTHDHEWSTGGTAPPEILKLIEAKKAQGGCY